MLWPIALKTLYTLLLFGIASVLVREAYLVWFDDRVFVGRFNIVTDGTSSNTDPAEFSSSIVSAQAVLSQQLTDYKKGGGSSVTDATFDVGETDRVELPKAALKGIDITIQDVNLTKVFSALRKGFAAPNEVTGHVTASEGSVLAAVDWPRAPKPAVGDNTLRSFFIPSQANLQNSARYIACMLSYARGAENSIDVAKIPQEQFCDFVMAVGELYALKEKAMTPDGINDSEVHRVRRRTEVLADHYDSPEFLSDIYRLRADLIDLLPDGKVTLSDLVQAQEDRLRYAVLSPEIAKLPEEEQRYTVLALARPAIRLSEGKLREIPGNWSSLLKRHSNTIEQAARSTALLQVYDASGQVRQLATAFVVAPNLAVTAGHALQPFKDIGPFPADVPKEMKATLCFGGSQNDCDDVLNVSKIHYLGDYQAGDDVALLEIDRHSPVFHPPLPIMGADTQPNALIGSYAFVLGFPFVDRRLPPTFLEKLIGEDTGVRRVIPGRILAYDLVANRFTSDISTTGGTSGGPLVHMSTGAVLAISIAGEWRGERGKFAYAIHFSDAVREMISLRLGGKSDLVPKDAPVAPAPALPDETAQADPVADPVPAGEDLE